MFVDISEVAEARVHEAFSLRPIREAVLSRHNLP